MKKFLLAYLVFLPTFLFSQKIVIENISRNDVEIRIIKEGILIHHHIMHHKDQLTIDDVGWYGTKILIRMFEVECDDHATDGNFTQFIIKDGWTEIFFDKKQLQEYHPHGGLLTINPIKCKRA